MKKFTETAKRETRSIGETLDRESKQFEKNLNREVDQALSEERNAPGRIFSVWPALWMLLASAVVAWDVAFVLLRPRTLPGGDLARFFGPYELYINVDRAYGDMDNSFTKAQCWLNVAEIVLSLVTVFLVLRRRVSGLVLGVVVNTMTFWKTVLYVVQYLPCCSGPAASLEHCSPREVLLLFVLPDGLWILMPGLCLWHYCRVLRRLLLGSVTARAAAKDK